MNFAPLSKQEEDAGKIIVDSAYKVHRLLGPGLVEKVYEPCFCHELSKQGALYRRQVIVPIEYDGIVFDEGLRLDVMVSELVICELKAVTEMNPAWEAQLLTYMKLSKKRLGFLINFSAPIIKEGIKRMIL